MAYQTIPTTNYPEQSFRIVLDGTSYAWRVYWSQYDDTIKEIVGDDIEGQWYADIESDQITIKGMALVTGADLLQRYAFDQLGALWVVDNEQSPSDVTFDSFGTRHTLLYIPKAEVESFNRAVGR